jgi:hypothetical protein
MSGMLNYWDSFESRQAGRAITGGLGAGLRAEDIATNP